MKKRKYASGGNTWGTVGSVASGVFGGLQNAFGNNKSQEDKVLYGDMWADPTQRMLNDFTGNGVKGLINEMNGNINTNIAPLDNNALFDRLSNIKRYDKKDLTYNTDVALGLLGNATGLLPLAPGFRYGKGAKNGVFSVDTDNLAASAQGAMSGLSYSGSPWGALVGGVAGGIFNYISDLTQNSKIRKYNKAVDNYNMAQNAITDQLLNNSNMMRHIFNAYTYKKLGGPLNTHGGDFQNGVVEIANGGTHEENPYEGVPMGMDQEGVPNLVEEGEYIWNDYVFSKRIDVPEDMRKKYKFGDRLSFADAVDKVQRESEERPNDPISKRGLNAILSELAMSQEIERQKQQQQEAFENAENLASTFADGGNIHINKNKRGTFTAAATKHNMGVQEFARHVLANKDKYSSTMIKKANFAHNAAGWKHALGGNLFKEGSKLSRKDRKAAAETLALETALDLRNNKDLLSEENAKNMILSNLYSQYNEDLNDAAYGFYPEVLNPDGTFNDLYYNNSGRYNDDGTIKNEFYHNSLKDTLGGKGFMNSLSPKYNRLRNGKLTTTAPIIITNNADYALRAAPSISQEKIQPEPNDLLGGTIPEVIIQNNDNYTSKSIPFARANLRTGYDFSGYLPNTYFTNQAWERTFTRPESSPLSNLENEAKKATIEPSGYVNPDGTLNVAKAVAESADNNKRTPYNERLRYAPLAGALGALLNDLRPIDYSNADRVGNAARSINRYRGYDPLSGYMEYRPVDINALTARMNAQQAADRRALLNMSNGNPAAAALMALAARYNDSRGDMLSKVDEINTARRNAVAGFNTDINKTNSQLDLNAQQMNQRAEQMYLSGINQEAAIRNALEAAQSEAVSNDYHSIFDSLGGIGKENAEMNMIYEMGMPFYYQDSDGNRHIVYRNSQKKCGGKLFKVKK